MQTKEYREQLAQTFIKVLEEKQLDWRKEWQGKGLNVPRSAKTGNRYHGINQFYLTLVAMERGYEDPRWATFKHIKDSGWMLHDAKGQGVKVEYWYPYDKEEKRSLTWDEFRRSGARLGERYFLKSNYSTVFNGTLIEGIPALPEPAVRDITPDAMAEKLSVNMGVKILNDGDDRAFYDPAEDKIHLPLPQSFESDYAYASTALHELAHSTGAKHRLNRDLTGRFGTPSYAFEELIAEISSCFMSANLQMEQSASHIDNHKAYVQSWISHIQEQPESLVKAVQQAEKTSSYMEYKAELINEQEYLKKNQSTVEVPAESIMETPAVSPAQTEDPFLDIFKAIETGSKEQIGRMLSEIRIDRGYSKDEVSEILLIENEELTLIEAGVNQPDSVTLQLIGNIYGIKIDELQKGNIVPLKSRAELSKMIGEIRTYVGAMKRDTHFFNEFMKKHGIEAPKQTVAEKEKDFYVIEDQVTGETMVDAAGDEVRTSSKEQAEKIAALLNREVKNSEDAKEIIDTYERSIDRTESVINGFEDESLLNYAAVCKHYLRFGQDVERSIQGTISNRDAILVCQTPETYVQVGCHPLPMYIKQRHLKNCMHRKEPINEQSRKRSKTHYHGMTLQEVKRIPEELELPAVIGQSLTNESSLVSLLGYKDQEGNPVMVSFLPDGKAMYELEIVESNFITSVYGRENADNFVERLADEGKILYVNENKSKELALSPLYLRQGHPVLASDSIIKPIDTDVKTAEVDLNMSESNTKVQKNIEPKI